MERRNYSQPFQHHCSSNMENYQQNLNILTIALKNRFFKFPIHHHYQQQQQQQQNLSQIIFYAESDAADKF